MLFPLTNKELRRALSAGCNNTMYVAGAYRETEKQPSYNLHGNMIVVRMTLNRLDERPSKSRPNHSLAPDRTGTLLKFTRAVIITFRQNAPSHSCRHSFFSDNMTGLSGQAVMH